MPKINAPTVREHRAAMETALVDAAEQLLIEQGTLTMSQVAARVGLSRNGVYKYAASADDLIERVAARHLPRWEQAVASAVQDADGPRDRVLAYVHANVAQAADGRHSWRVALASSSLSPEARGRIAARHVAVAGMLREALDELGVADPDLVHGAVQALLNAAVGQVEAGVPVDAADRFTRRAVALLLDDAAARSRRSA